MKNNVTVNSVFNYVIFISFMLTMAYPRAEKVSKFTFLGSPETLHKQKTLTLHEEVVAMSENIYVDAPSNIKELTTGGGSLFFIIDNSGSMKGMGMAKDQWGSRFTVTSALLDTLYTINPKTQVGIGIFLADLFFDPQDDPIFKKCASSLNGGAYIPLLTLDSLYNGLRGYDILKKYLNTDTVNQIIHKYVDVTYSPTNTILSYGGTNITLGFEAAKDAMKESKYDKKNQFAIFFSDGEATSPPLDPEKFKYVQGIDVPTTFTIYFTQQSVALDNLNKMTTNIKNNGYSSTNPKSNLWTLATGHEKLMKLLMENVIGNIIQQKFTATPKSVSVNTGQKSSIYDGKKFTFDTLFPLIGETTEFSYTIPYTITYDTIIGKDTITKELKDTTAKYEYAVKIKPNIPLPDSIKLEYWDRTINYYHDGNKIDKIDENIDEVEVRFKESKIDVKYNYKDVSLILISEKAKDKEIFKLKKKDSFFTTKFKHEKSTANIGDGVLQHTADDKIIAIFRNPDLPLDTLRAVLLFKLKGSIEVKQAFYFDADKGDGYIDSIFLTYESNIELTQDHVYEIINHISLPPARKLKIKSASVSKDGIELVVKQESSAGVQTFVTVEDKLNINEKILKAGGILIGGTISIEDRIAPLIEYARLIDYVTNEEPDTLHVAFTEKIIPVSQDKPFLFLSMTEKMITYSAQLKKIADDDSIMTFQVIKLEKTTFNNAQARKDLTMMEGDSIWISTKELNVEDIIKNVQKHPTNRKRKLFVERRLEPFKLIAQGVTPINLASLKSGNGPTIDNTIIKHLDLKNKTAINKNNNTGMLIIVKPEKKLLLSESEFELKGTLTIFDPVANQVISRQKMGYYPKMQSLVFVWDCKNNRNRYIGNGSFLAYFTVDSYQGPQLNFKQKHEPLTLLLGVRH